MHSIIHEHTCKILYVMNWYFLSNTCYVFFENNASIMLCLLQGNCGKRVQIRRTLLNVPDVVSIGLVWGSDRPDLELTTEVAKTIGTTLLLPDVSTVGLACSHI